MEQERRLKRRHLIYYLRVFDRSKGTLLGHLVDITPEGMMLICEKSIQEGATFPCAMSMPNVAEQATPLQFNADCVWCKKDVNPDFYAAGFRIDKLSLQDRNALASLVEAFGFQD